MTIGRQAKKAISVVLVCLMLGPAFLGLPHKVSAASEASVEVKSSTFVLENDNSLPLTAAATLLPAPSLYSPGNGQTGVSTTPIFSWSSVPGANYYWLTVATSPSYLPTDPNAASAPGCVIGSNGIGTSGTSYTPSSPLSAGVTYYWKVQPYHGSDALHPDQQGNYSSQWSFTTASAPPAATLSFTSLTPSTITTSDATYTATLYAGGSNFNNVNRVTFNWSGPDSSSATWNRGDSSWNAGVTVNSDTSMTLRPRVLSNVSGTQSLTWNWTVTLRDTTGQTTSQYFTVTYTPPAPPAATLSFTSLTPFTITTSDATYTATLYAGGSNFNNVNRVTFNWSGPDSSSATWNRGDSSWNAGVAVNSDISMTLRPRVLSNVSGTQSQMWNWTVTLRDTTGQTTSQYFTVTYTPSAVTETNIITITSVPTGASFILSGPTTYTGTTPWRKSNALAGSYTISWNHIDGYAMPSSSTITLIEGGGYSLECNYVPATEKGYINVTSNLSGASFSLSGPTSYSGTTTWSTGNAPEGSYTITWYSIGDYTTPPSETKTLPQGGSISFYGDYQQAASQLDNPPNVTFFSASASEINQGQSVTLSYTVSDDIGLKQVELWRADDTAGVDFSEIKRSSVSGKVYSGSFSDAPSSPGTYRYGLHVVDTAGEWNCERNSRTGFSPGIYGPKDVVVKDATQSKCWSIDKLSNEELADLVIRHFPEGIIPQTSENIRVTAYAVARAESDGNPTACGDNDQSIGLWQIHMPSHPQYNEQYLFDPDNNAEAAKQDSNNGRDWNPWCTWEKSACDGNGNERYKRYLNEARAAIGVIGRDTTPPTVSISYPSNGQSFTNSQTTVTGTASDDIAVGKVEVRVGSQSWQTASGTTSWSIQLTLSLGSNTIYARAVDTSGNTSGQISVNVNLKDSNSNSYNRLAAVEYAIKYAYKACDCRKWYGPTEQEAAMNPDLNLLLPRQIEPGNTGLGIESGTDCAHFVSHCLAAGGLNNKGTAYAKGWCGYMIRVHEMRQWFNETGLATKLSSVNQLEPGDVIIMNNGDHITLYLGNNKFASHSAYGVATYKFNSQDEYWHINCGSYQGVPHEIDTIQPAVDQQAAQPLPENTPPVEVPQFILQRVQEIMDRIRSLFGQAPKQPISQDVIPPDNPLVNALNNLNKTSGYVTWDGTTVHGVWADTNYTYCARFVRMCFGEFTPRFETALEMYNHFNQLNMVNSGTHPPRGAVVFYGAHSENRQMGHAGIADGGGNNYSVVNKTNGVLLRAVTGAFQAPYLGYVTPADFKAYHMK